MKYAYCIWCNQEIVDGRKVSGYTGEHSDWATIDDDDKPSDFGCDSNPITNEDGCGSHATMEDLTRIYVDYNTIGEK